MATTTTSKSNTGSGTRKERAGTEPHRRNSGSGTPTLGRTFYLQPGEEIEPDALAKTFRPVAGHEERLAEDLKVNGQIRPGIVVKAKNGKRKMMDGNTRRKILHAMGRSVECVEYDEQEWRQLLEAKGKTEEEYLLGINTNEGHRQLSDDQKAITLMDFFPTVKAQRKEHSEGGKELKDNQKPGRTTEVLASLLPGVTRNRVDNALELRERPALQDAVWNGNIAMSMAATIARRIREADGAIAAAKPAAEAGDKSQQNKLNQFIAIRNELHRAIELAGTKDGKKVIKSILNAPSDGLRLNDASRDSYDELRTHKRNMKAFIEWFHLEGTDTDAIRKSVRAGVDITNVATELENLSRAMPSGPCDACDGKGDGCAQCNDEGWLTVARLEEVKNRRRRGK